MTPSAVCGHHSCCAVRLPTHPGCDSPPTGSQDSPVCSVIRSAAAGMAPYVGLKAMLGLSVPKRWSTRGNVLWSWVSI
jgi:hypothetical protein